MTAGGRNKESDIQMRGNVAGIAVERKRRAAEFSMQEDHYHAFYELYYLVSGRCRVFLNHTIHHLEAGNFILIEPQALHHTIYGIVQESERVAVCFGEEHMLRLEGRCGSRLRQMLTQYPCIPVEAGRRGYVEQIFRKLAAEQGGQDSYTELLMEQYLYELLAFLGRWGEEKRRHPQLEPAARAVPGGTGKMGNQGTSVREAAVQEAAVQEAAAQEAAVQDAARYICGHFQEPLTLAWVAEQVHLSPAYFSRRFKSLTGFGYKEYLNYVRLKEASRLLLETGLPVTEIARRCGFSDGNYFGDVFRKEKGMSPRLYRKNPQIWKTGAGGGKPAGKASGWG